MQRFPTLKEVVVAEVVEVLTTYLPLHSGSYGGGRQTFAPVPLLCVQNGGRWWPSLHLRGGRTEGLATLNQALMKGHAVMLPGIQ